MTRPIDPHWEAVLDAFSLRSGPLNSNERGKVNKAIKLWKESEGEPGEWQSYVGWYRKVFPHAVCTPIAVASNRSMLRGEALRHGWLRREAPVPTQTQQPPVYVAPTVSCPNPEMRKHTQALLARLKR